MHSEDEIINVENLQKYTKNHIKAILIGFLIILIAISCFFANTVSKNNKKVILT